MSDDQAAVAAELAELTGNGSEAATDSARSTRQLYAGDPERLRTHKDIITSYLGNGVEAAIKGKRVVVTAGPPRAGKSTFIDSLGLVGYRHIDSDEIKDILLRRAVDDGAYDDLLGSIWLTAYRSARGNWRRSSTAKPR